MMVYTIGTVLSMLFARVSTDISRKRKYYRKYFRNTKIISGLLAVVSFVPLTLISAIRYEVGVDYSSYVNIYRNQAAHYTSINESLFAFFVQSLHKISEDPLIFFAVCSILICGAYYVIIYKKSQDPTLSILLFVITLSYFRSMDAIRQCLAMAILLFSLPGMENGNWKKSVPFILLAYFVHNSALLFFILFLLCKIKVSPLLMIGGVLASLFLASNFRLLALRLLQGFTHYIRYFSKTNSYSTVQFRWSYVITYLAFFLLMLYLYYVEKITFSNRMYVLFNAILIGLCFSILSIVFPRNINRLVWYMDSVLVLYVPDAIEGIQRKRTRFLVKWGILLGFFSMNFVLTLRGANGVLPYITFLER